MPGERPVVLQLWCCYSWGLFLGLWWCFEWSGLQTIPLEAVVLLHYDSSCCCSSLVAVWGFHIRLDAQFVPSTLHCTCSVGMSQCVYHNIPHALWTDWKQAPVHSIGMGSAAENIQNSAMQSNHEEIHLHNNCYVIEMVKCVIKIRVKENILQKYLVNTNVILLNLQTTLACNLKWKWR